MQQLEVLSMPTRRRNILLAAFLLSSLLAAAALTVLHSPADRAGSIAMTQPVSAPLRTADPVSDAALEASYLLRSENGAVSIYQNGALLRRTDIPVSALPQCDRAALEQGIHVAGDADLARILEDLGS